MMAMASERHTRRRSRHDAIHRPFLTAINPETGYLD